MCAAECCPCRRGCASPPQGDSCPSCEGSPPAQPGQLENSGPCAAFHVSTMARKIDCSKHTSKQKSTVWYRIGERRTDWSRSELFSMNTKHVSEYYQCRIRTAKMESDIAYAPSIFGRRNRPFFVHLSSRICPIMSMCSLSWSTRASWSTCSSWRARATLLTKPSCLWHAHALQVNHFDGCTDRCAYSYVAFQCRNDINV